MNHPGMRVRVCVCVYQKQVLNQGEYCTNCTLRSPCTLIPCHFLWFLSFIRIPAPFLFFGILLSQMEENGEQAQSELLGVAGCLQVLQLGAFQGWGLAAGKMRNKQPSPVPLEKIECDIFGVQKRVEFNGTGVAVQRTEIEGRMPLFVPAAL